MGVRDVDKYYQLKKEIIEERWNIVPKIYCDASYKDGVMVAAIIVLDNTGSVVRNKVIQSDVVLDGEVAAIQLALEYVEQHFLKEVFIYTEIDDVIHTHIYAVINNIHDIKLIPAKHRAMYANYRNFWSYFRCANKRTHIILDKIKSAHNPAHAIACQKREKVVHQRIRGKIKNGIALLCNQVIAWVEN